MSERSNENTQVYDWSKSFYLKGEGQFMGMQKLCKVTPRMDGQLPDLLEHALTSQKFESVDSINPEHVIIVQPCAWLVGKQSIGKSTRLIL